MATLFIIDTYDIYLSQPIKGDSSFVNRKHNENLILNFIFLKFRWEVLRD